MARKKSLDKQPFGIFFPDAVKNKLSRIKKKDHVLFDQLRKRFEKLQVDPECGEILSYDKKGHREVHVKDHWVVIYRVDYSSKIIVIVEIGIHNKALGL